jgi:hypothetical protein
MPGLLKPQCSTANPQPCAEAASSQPLRRRELFGVAASSFAALVNACRPAAGRTEVVRTPEGKVHQWQSDDLLVLVSGLQESYRLGQEVRLKVMLNNQTAKLGQYRLRTKLVGRRQQVVAEAPVADMQVQPFNAGEVERVLSAVPPLEPGDYTLIVELPPWSLEGRTTGGGALSAPLQLAG